MRWTQPQLSSYFRIRQVQSAHGKSERPKERSPNHHVTLSAPRIAAGQVAKLFFLINECPE